MSRTLVIVFAALLAVNAVVGTVALTRTVDLGGVARRRTRSSRSAPRQLHRLEASLHAQLAKNPPPLPKVPSGRPRVGRRSRDSHDRTAGPLRASRPDHRPQAPRRRRARGRGPSPVRRRRRR